MEKKKKAKFSKYWRGRSDQLCWKHKLNIVPDGFESIKNLVYKRGDYFAFYAG